MDHEEPPSVSATGINTPTLSNVLRARAISDTNSRVFTFLSQHLDTQAFWTFGDLHKRAVLLAARIRQECDSGDRVLLPFDHGPEFIASFFGCLYAGVVAVPIQPSRGNRDFSRLQAIAYDAGARYGLTTSNLLAKLTTLPCSESERQITWLTVDDMDVAQDSQRPDFLEPSPTEVAYLQYTSGSTAQPRGVMITHQNVISNLEAIDDDFHHSKNSKAVTWLPHYHDMGLVYGLLQPLYNGYECYVLSPASFAQRPLCWLEALTRYHATHSGGPNFAYDFCTHRITPSQRHSLNLCTWQIAFNGAETVRQETMDHFTAAFAGCGFRKEAFYPTYGLAEATLKVTGRQFNDYSNCEGKGIEIDLEGHVSCGFPSGSTQICIVDPESKKQLQSGRLGEIWVRGPSVGQGYWNKPEETRKTFEAQLARSLDGNGNELGFLRTGDIGFVNESGLTITGRLKDIVIIRGQCYHPEDIEWTAQNACPLGRSKLFAAFTVEIHSEERLVVIHESGPHLPKPLTEAIRLIRSSIASVHGLSVYAIAFAFHIPKTSSGKVKRHACKAMFLAGDRTISHVDILEPQTRRTGEGRRSDSIPMGSKAPLDPILRITDFILKEASLALRSELSLADIDTPLSSLGLDSLAALAVCHAIQLTFDVDVQLSFAIESTPTSIARSIHDSLSTGTKHITGTLRQPGGSDFNLPVFPEQERLWLMQNVAPRSSSYNLASAVRIHGYLDSSVLEASLMQMKQRHQSLRSVFHLQNETLSAYLVADARAHLSTLDLCGRDNLTEASIHGYLSAEVDKPFDLAHGPLIRALLVRIEEQHSIIIFTFHHIISDMWSQRVFLNEIFDTYKSLIEGRPLDKLPAAGWQYGDFVIDYLESNQNRESDLNYWKTELAGAPSALPLRFDKPPQPLRNHRAGQETLFLDDGKFNKLRVFAESEHTTKFVVLLAAYAVLLNQLSDSEDIVIAIPFSNRDRTESRNLIGLFAQPMAIRIDLSGNPGFRQIVHRIRAVVLRAIEHHAVPFADVIRQARPNRQPGRLPLAQTFFSLNPVIFEHRKTGELLLEAYDIHSSCTDFDLQFMITEGSGRLAVRLRYAADLFTSSSAASILRSYENIVTRLNENPDTQMVEFRTLHVLTNDIPPEHAETICVASSFTAEPLMEFFLFWMRIFDWSPQIKFASFGQVFQALLGGDEGWGNSRTGVRVLLLRVEDWAMGSATMKQTAYELVDAVRNAAESTSATYIVYVCPRSAIASADASFCHLIREAEQIILDGLASTPHTKASYGADVATLYSVEDYDDTRADRLGGIPYSSEFYAAIATTIFRQTVALHRAPFKVIACDCDNTLWNGIIAEDGVDNISISRSGRRLHEILSFQKGKGMLLCLCSKNTEDDVAKAFSMLHDMGVGWNDFAAKRINWAAKSENLRSLATELGLGLDSVIFIDDDPVECAEVNANCPEVLTVDLPKDSCMAFLDHYWAFDTAGNNAGDKNRTDFYLADKQRKSHVRLFRDMGEFIRSLNVRTDSDPLDFSRLPRVVELMYRTNQFNSTGLKMPIHELRSRIESGGLDGRVFYANDRFGDYGLVGVVIFSFDSGDLIVKSMLLSCRALGRDIEFRMAAECGRIADEKGLAHVNFQFSPTHRNRPVHDFLENTIGGREVRADCTYYRISSLGAATVKGTCSGSVNPTETQQRESDSVLVSGSRSSLRLSAVYKRIATSLRTGRSVVEASRGTSSPSPSPFRSKVPNTCTEEAVAQIWRELLGGDNIDLDGEFFELGGDSLKATRVLSHIEAKFEVALPLSLFFEGRVTIAALSAILERALKEPGRSRDV
jgi:FkbH-like protein